MAGANVGPLAQVGLAQNDGAGLAQFLRHERIFRRTRTHQRQRSGRGLHAVGGVDVVFDQDGNAVQRAARALGFALLVEGLRDGQGVGIEFDHAIDGRPAPVYFFDPGHVFLGEGLSCEFSRCHTRLEICDGELVELEASNFGRAGAAARHLAGAGQRRQQGGADSANDSSLNESAAGRNRISGKCALRFAQSGSPS